VEKKEKRARFLMECPACKQDEAELFADTDPNGLIGIFCRNCSKAHTTKDPDQGWDEVNITSLEAILDLKAMHNIDVPDVMLNIAMFDRRINGAEQFF